MFLKNNYFQKIDLKSDLLSLRSVINWILFSFTFGLFVLAIQDVGFSNPDKTSMFQIHNRYFQISYPIIGALYVIRAIFFKGNTNAKKVFITQLVIGLFMILFFVPSSFFNFGDTFEYYLYQTSGIQMLAFFLFFLDFNLHRTSFLLNFAY